MEQTTLPDISTQARGLGDLSNRILAMAGVLLVGGGGGALAMAWTSDGGLNRLSETYLVSFAYFLSLALGALFFVLLQHLTRAGWSVVVRRLAEAISANVWLMAILAVPIVLNMDHLYHWAHPGVTDHDLGRRLHGPRRYRRRCHLVAAVLRGGASGAGRARP